MGAGKIILNAILALVFTSLFFILLFSYNDWVNETVVGLLALWSWSMVIIEFGEAA
jgi:hypothetical protein